jgi:hypothetical protein
MGRRVEGWKRGMLRLGRRVKGGKGKVKGGKRG